LTKPPNCPAEGDHLSRLDHGPAEESRNGYNVLRWNQDGMAFYAVSDLNPQELADFARLWRAG
jgi:hypothetical protein